MDPIEVQVSGGQGIVPATYKTIVLKPNIVNGKNMLTQAMFAQTDTKYVIKYDYIIDDDIVTESVQVLSSNVSQCVNPAYTEALASYNEAHDAWIDADNAYTNNPNDTTLAAKNSAYAAYNAAQTTLNNIPQYYYYAAKVISLHKGQHIIIPDNCVLLNSSLNAIAGFKVAPIDSIVYIGGLIPGTYEYTVQEAIQIPARCLIEFDGGSISDGTIVGDNTYLIFNQKEEDILKNVTLLGNFIYSTADPADKKDNVNGMAKVYLKKNKSFASQLTQPNTIYVIQYDFILEEDVIIPENCILEFDGGTVSGDYYIDFELCKNRYLYASWFGQDTLLKSIPYMSEKTLYIDKDMTLTSPITNRGSDKFLTSFALKGLATRTTRQENRAKILCDDCIGVDIYGYRNTVSGITFEILRSTDATKPFIKLDTSGEHNTDLDSRIYSCGFQHFTVARNNMIVTYGRGLSVYDCTFVGGVNDSNILCYMKTTGHEDPSDPSVNDEYGGRRFWFHHNTVHSNSYHFVHIAKNPDAPDVIFRGIRIENNNADIGSKIANIECKNVGTSIIGNTFLGAVAAAGNPFIYCKDSHKLLISNNIFTGGYIQYPGAQHNYKYIKLAASEGETPSEIVISTNIVQTYAYFVEAECNIKNISITGNTFTEGSFDIYAEKAIYCNPYNSDTVLIADNCFDNPGNGDEVNPDLLHVYPAILGRSNAIVTIKNVKAHGNVGVIPVLAPDSNDTSTWIVENVDVEGFYPPAYGDTRRYNKLNVHLGFSFFNREPDVQKLVTAVQINDDGFVTWADVFGKPLSTVYPRLYGTITNGNLAKIVDDLILDAGMSGTGTEGAIARFDENGKIADSGIRLNEVARIYGTPTTGNLLKYVENNLLVDAGMSGTGVAGNLAGFDEDGNLTDSGSKPSDFEPAQS